MNVHVIKPLITEKTMHMAGGGWYTFQADCNANKNEIRKEIETLYGVSVLSIRTSLMHGKVRRVGRKSLRIAKSDWKKASVRLKAGQTIDAFQIGGPEEKK